MGYDIDHVRVWSPAITQYRFSHVGPNLFLLLSRQSSKSISVHQQKINLLCVRVVIHQSLHSFFAQNNKTGQCIVKFLYQNLLSVVKFSSTNIIVWCVTNQPNHLTYMLPYYPHVIESLQRIFLLIYHKQQYIMS